MNTTSIQDKIYIPIQRTVANVISMPLAKWVDDNVELYLLNRIEELTENSVWAVTLPIVEGIGIEAHEFSEK